MGLFRLFKTKSEEISIKPATTGRVLKEIAEVNLTSKERKILLDFYQNLMSIDEQEGKLRLISYIARLVLDLPLTQIENPVNTGEYITHTKNRWQSSRCKSLFSKDAGQTWYDIDNDTWINQAYRWIFKQIFRSSLHTPEFIAERILPYVSFPYTKNIKQSYFK